MLVAALVASTAGLATPSIAQGAPEVRTPSKSVPRGAVRKRHRRGLQAYADTRWFEAGQAWSDVLDQIPENPVHRELRVNVLLDSIHAYEAAFDETSDPAHLQAALDTYYRYFGVFEVTYNSTNIPRAVVAARFELRDALAEASLPS